ncbi:TetR/AcrR family transcriptional regulator [Tsukamurella asaccharolytica]|uniref:TetR/AcrR family transcriptional regulator n=1 Tax=Tsukamurella asaccharolytica TaxID=2592067 RepID=A0A5C5REU5_9ACTN|nr:TetR/AcrR family transcriptional regulator [Tsukamurella asaccharolytica]TWS21064.1 TetR/AcrR family transcriptional regulator [Tsukamurella asaccharolytica]
MTGTGAAEPTSRLEQRKVRTRAALIAAGQRLLAEGRTDVAVSVITDTADVGLGSFYNHFATKEALFAAASEAAAQEIVAGLDDLTAEIADPVERFTACLRLVGRMHRRLPQLSGILLRSGAPMLSVQGELMQFPRRDLLQAVERERFAVADADLALAMTAGAMLMLGQLLVDDPERDDAAAADAMARTLLIGFGVDPGEAERICALPLPVLPGND